MAAMPGSRIFVGLAEEYRRAGRFADALATLNSGLESHPTYLSARIAIARLYQETGRFPEAIDAFSKVLVTDRENLVAAKALGDIHSRQGNALEAVKKYKLYRALSGDRAVDEKIATLERETKGDLPSAPSRETVAAPAPHSRMFDPLSDPDSGISGAFSFEPDPNATRSLSTLEFEPASEPPVPIETTRPFRIDPASITDVEPDASGAPEAISPVVSAVESSVSVPTVETSAAISEQPRAADAPEAAMASDSDLEAAASSSSPADLPPSRTLAELYENQGFREEARGIYERLVSQNPDDESLVRRLARVGENTPPAAPGDLRARKREILEAWLARVKANAATSA